MRLKTICNLPIRHYSLMLWAKLTLSRLTIFYFLFSLSHSILQVLFQAQAFQINANAANFINSVIVAGNASSPGFSLLEGDLKWCKNLDESKCQVIWSPEPSQTVVAPSANIIASKPSKRQPPNSFYSGPPLSKTTHTRRSFTSLVTSNTPGGTIVTLTSSNGNPNLNLDETCLLALNWPLETLDNTKREDITFVCFHLWVLGMSVVALLNESIPHLIASIISHVVLTAWSAFQLLQTKNFQSNFVKIVTDGSCGGENLLPTYWRDRANAEIPSAVLNGIALLFSAWLTWKLGRTYSWATFKRIGADRKISKIYKLVLSLSVVLQLSVFFIVVSIALWIDQLCNGDIGRFATHMTLYRGTYITVLLLLVPWIIIGWKAVRSENRRWMAVFLGFNVLLIGGWASMFSSITFRWTFMQWKFFELMEIAALILMVGTLTLGVWCRLNFGSDLSKYLWTQSRIEDEEDFVSASVSSPRDFDLLDEKRRESFTSGSGFSFSEKSEKIDFPTAAALPTFGSAFGGNRNNSQLSNSSQGSFGDASNERFGTLQPTSFQGSATTRRDDPNRISISSAKSYESFNPSRHVDREASVRSDISSSSGKSGSGRYAVSSGGKMKKVLLE